MMPCNSERTVKEEFEKELADFLIFYAKFEYALKTSRYLKSGRGKCAEPDWGGFKRDVKTAISLDIFAKIAEDSDIKYLCNKPPQRQKTVSCGDSTAGFRIKDKAFSPCPVASPKDAIEACKVVRNNLFHGGKCNSADRDRDRKLLRGARKFLQEILDRMPDTGNSNSVQNAFKSAIL